MAKEKSKTHRHFRSVLAVKKAYLPELLKSQRAEDIQEVIEKTTKVTKHTLRKRVRT